MDWTPEMKIKLIRALAALEFNNPDSQKDRLICIMFLCDMPDEFLEINKTNFQEAIEAVERGGIVVGL